MAAKPKPLDPAYSVSPEKMKKLLGSKVPSKAGSKPSPRVKVAPMQSTAEQKRQDKALKDLMAKRAAESKRTGLYPNYYTN